MLPENGRRSFVKNHFRVTLPENHLHYHFIIIFKPRWVLTDGHDLAPCAANSLHRVTMSVCNVIGGTGTLGIA